MSSRIPETAQELKPETVEKLQELVRGLHDSHEYLIEAAEKIESDHFPAENMRSIAVERNEICENIGKLVAMNNEEPAEEGTWSGSLRKIWTAFRAGLNAGDTTVVLIEAERAEDAIVHKFEDVLKDVAGCPVNDELLEHYKRVKHGHDLIRNMRDSYQAA